MILDKSCLRLARGTVRRLVPHTIGVSVVIDEPGNCLRVRAIRLPPDLNVEFTVDGDLIRDCPGLLELHELLIDAAKEAKFRSTLEAVLSAGP